ncbi:hypothetical protein BGW37DRAFT_533500 [Umbelopsis sp. PMI_123]|nr:hypothetical protein BGW37DRAFT_533500 [Umbelopsis sp. PMI_123]
MLSRVNYISRALFRTSTVARAAGTVHGRTQLSVSKYPALKRDPRFQSLNDKHIEYFRTVLGENSVVYDKDPESDNILQYNTDWFNLYRGTSSLVLFPSDTAQVSSILKYCNENRLAVVPQGGNTGVSGGAVPVFDEIIIKMSRMDRIRKIDKVSGIVVADAGVILENLDNAVSEHGYMVPVDLGAKGSCHIGGNISTNAGGLRYVRYGSLHGNVLGLEVVLPDGTILDNLSTLRKDNTGYDVKQLFMGAEGTLGIVTAVSILTPQRAKATNLALIGLNSYEDIQKAFVRAKADLSDILSAFEFWDKDCIEVVSEKMLPGVQFPLSSEKPYEFYALLETQGSRKEHDEAKLESYLEKLLEDKIARDGVVSQDIKQAQGLWAWREMIPEGMTKYGPAITYDVSMDIPLLYKLVLDTRAHFEKKGMIGPDKDYVKMIGFGHVGDGNLHIMAATNRNDYSLQKQMDDYVYKWAAEHGGSVSAEHGIGISKIEYLPYCKKKPVLDLMVKLKSNIDPRGIMNPYKIFGSVPTEDGQKIIE